MCQNSVFKKFKLQIGILIISVLFLTKLSNMLAPHKRYDRGLNSEKWHQNDNLNVSHYLINSKTFLEPKTENLKEVIIFVR